MNPSEAISASFRPSYRPDRQVRSTKPHIGFGKMLFSPPIGVNAPFPRPEITTYGKRPVRFSDPDGLETLSGKPPFRPPGISMNVPTIRMLEACEEASIHERNNEEERLP